MSHLSPLPKQMWWCNFRATEAISVEGENLHAAGKFLVAWPYDREPSLSLDLAFKVGRVVTEWQKTYMKRPYEQLKNWLKMASVVGVIIGPKIEGEDKDGTQLRKLIFFGKFVFLNYALDDQLEIAASRHDFPQLMFYASQLLYLVESNNFSSLEALQAHEYYGKILLLDPNLEEFYHLLWDWAQELHKDYVDSPEKAHYYCLEHYKTFSSLSWCGSKGSSHMENAVCYQDNRLRNSAGLSGYEMRFLLAGLQVPDVIRENVYWQRVYLQGPWLNTYVNDFFSFEREWKAMERDGATMDNSVYLHMRNAGAKFGDAIKHIAQRHDQILLEYRAINEFLRANPAFTGTEDEEMREVFFKSLELIAVFDSRVFQIHQLSRFSRMELQFVECDGEEIGDVLGRNSSLTLEL